jgi:microsomal dipeptidase-like Zn-dependent dipeptidase
VCAFLERTQVGRAAIVAGLRDVTLGGSFRLNQMRMWGLRTVSQRPALTHRQAGEGIERAKPKGLMKGEE